MDARHVFVQVEGDKSLILQRYDSPLTAGQVEQMGLSYWALDAEASAFAPLLIHVYYTGARPDDPARERINTAVRGFVDSLLGSHLTNGGSD